MQTTIESLESLGISLDHDIKCEFTRGGQQKLPCEGIAVVRIRFKCKCGHTGEAFICAECLELIRNNPEHCWCAKCWKTMKPHKWSRNRVKWKEI